MSDQLVLALGFAVICGLVSAVIAKHKNLDPGGYFILGCLLSVIGIAVVLLVKKGDPPIPDGMQAVTCKRCSMRQNISAGDKSYECWQCHLTNKVSQKEHVDRGPEDTREWLRRVKGNNT